MAPFSVAGLRIAALSAAVPAREVRNTDLEPWKGAAGQTLVRTVGIDRRRVAPATLCASDLCVAAALDLLRRVAIRPHDVGALVFVTQTPDYLLPGNSVLVQQRLGLARSTCLLDLNQGCAGYVYGLVTLAAVMSAASIERGLLLVGDTITRLLDRDDPSTVPIFADAGSATLLEADRGAPPMHFNLGSDGSGAAAIRVEAGGARHPYGAADGTVPGTAGAPGHLSMRGVDVLHYTMQYVEPNIRELLAFAGADVQSPDYYVFHQANQILNASLTRRFGIGAERVPETLSEYGNTSVATIPVTICRRLSTALASGAPRILLSGFGSGFSWGSALVDMQGVRCAEPIDVGEAVAV